MLAGHKSTYSTFALEIKISKNAHPQWKKENTLL
jgi:hypothetical protein